METHLDEGLAGVLVREIGLEHDAGDVAPAWVSVERVRRGRKNFSIILCLAFFLYVLTVVNLACILKILFRNTI